MIHTIKEVIDRLDGDRATSQNQHWNISPETGVFLNTLVRATQAQRVLEIGTSTGYSGLYLADALKETGGSLVTIESHAERFEQANVNFLQAGILDIVTQVKGHAPEILSTIHGMFDIFFFDATKEEHGKYIDAIGGQLRVHGILITDNAISHRSALDGYITALEKNPQWQNVLVPIGSGLLFSLKVA